MDTGGENDFDTTQKNGDRSVTNDGSLGILEVLPGGSGFIRRREESYTPGKDDIYVGARVIQKFDLRTGDELQGDVGKKPKNGKSPPLRHLNWSTGFNRRTSRAGPLFSQMGAQHPDEPFKLECGRTIRGAVPIRPTGSSTFSVLSGRGSGP